MKILVTFAVDDEFAPWRKLRSFDRVDGIGLDAYRSSVQELEILAILTGVGGKKAWVSATRAIWNLDIDICISSGLAGGLRVDRVPGEVVVAQRVESKSWNRQITCDAEMVDLAGRCGAKIIDKLLSVDRVITSALEKRQLGADADAVDMESGDVLAEAQAFGSRVVAIRAISDSVDTDLPIDFNRVLTDEGAVRLTSVLVELVRTPMALPALVRFGTQSRAAAEKLAVVLERYVQYLARVSSNPKEIAAI